MNAYSILCFSYFYTFFFFFWEGCSIFFFPSISSSRYFTFILFSFSLVYFLSLSTHPSIHSDIQTLRYMYLSLYPLFFHHYLYYCITPTTTSPFSRIYCCCCRNNDDDD